MSGFAEFLSNLRKWGLESFGRYYSSYRGYVYDNEDPDKLNKLKLVIPSVTGPSVHVNWAYPKNVYSGKNYGIQILPQKGDMVWVEFEHGNPKYPIWNYGGYGKNELPSEFSSTKVYGFKTPKGNYVTINDTTGEILIYQKDGSKTLYKKDLIQFNTGSNKGLVKIEKLIEDLNNRSDREKDIVLALQAIATAATGTGSTPVTGTSLAGFITSAIANILVPVTPSTLSNLEDPKVTH